MLSITTSVGSWPGACARWFTSFLQRGGPGWGMAPYSRPPRIIPEAASPAEYDNRMKRITVSLPDELVEKIRRAAGGERQVSSYVAAALEDYQERENLDDILAAWRSEAPVPDEVRRQVEAELDQAGLTGQPQQGGRMAG
jgi:predicted transcriptional regulator